MLARGREREAAAARHGRCAFTNATDAPQQRVLGDWIASAIAGPDLEHVRFFLGEVCGIPSPTGDDHVLRGVRDDPTKLAPRAQWAFVRLLAVHCARRPLVLVFEDLHWGDLPTVRMVDAALHVLADAPLFVLALARPEVHDIFPKLWGSRSPQVTSLGELGARCQSGSSRISSAIAPTRR